MVDINRYISFGLPWEENGTGREDPFRDMEEGHICAICKEAIPLNNINMHSVVAECKHCFHAACLAPYFVQLERGALSLVSEHPKCPTCRANIRRVWTTSSWQYGRNWGRAYWPSACRSREDLREIQFNRFSPIPMPELQRL
ncbi:hypothetical protein F4821DRAFT_214837 [Hypoxylon rubiginosum]|uniref:Uncharacterized protein n=1 Tax=Hypoxylon rubiginosum TaxID=110542 RepID=A0ACC0CQ28_9PEZI|nr:hypothetical protein F4821DRAFT_214837 [Hypoxylon rubiginosum]